MATPEGNNRDNPQDDAARSQQSTSSPLVLPEKFDGTGNYEEWISHFESIAAINKWDEEEKSLWIQIRLTEKAHVALTRLPSETSQMYEAIKAALRECFEPSSKLAVYKAEFENHSKRKTENCGDFGDELLRLVYQAFSNLQFEGKEQLALST